MSEPVGDPNRFADASKRAAEIKSKQTDLLRSVSSGLSQSEKALDRVLSELTADEAEADAYFPRTKHE